ncbi:MAG: YcnI family protein [Pseudonocardia sp.]|nr:YcnI family protein [Pseudonocardia sp.]
MIRNIGRGAAVATLAGGVLLAAAAPALAHVTAQPGTATQGGYTVISLRVPNESDTASTVKLQVAFPAEHPVGSARTTLQPGWTAEVVTTPLATPIQRGESTVTKAVRTVTFTAQPGTKIGPGQYLDFPISVGPLPDDTDTLVLPATQTYDDGTVVAWDQTAAPGAEEPQHPAPTVTLTPAAAGSDAHGMPAGADPHSAATGDETDTTARWLGGGGLLLGALGLGLGGGAALRNRRSAATSGPKGDRQS